MAKSHTGKSTPLRKILWSLDAFPPASQQANVERHVAETLKHLVAASGSSMRIEPVYVLSPDQLDLSMEFTAPWVQKYRPTAEQALRRHVASSGLTQVGAPQVLVQKKPSLTQAARTLDAYARKAKADLIVTSTHARAGLQRLFLGSFAETLLLQSKTPILVVPPEAQVPQGFKRVLMPTDFSAKSRAVFRSFLPLARALGARITLLHAIPNPVGAVMQTGVYLAGGGWMPVPAYMTDREQGQRKVGEAWVKEAAKAGVEAELAIDASDGGAVGAVLARTQKGSYDLIAMAAESGAVSAALLGSVARQVLRQATCPVWVSRG